MKPRLLLSVLAMVAVFGNVQHIRAAPFSFQAPYVNRIFSGPWAGFTELNTYFSTFHYVYPQRSLVLTPNSDFMTELEANLGALGVNEYYKINSAVLVIGSPADDYVTTGLAGAYEILVSYDPNTVSWNDFGDGGAPGVQYAPAATAIGVLGADSTSWTLTDVVRDWLSGASNNYGLFFPDFPADTGTTATNEYTSFNNVVWHIDGEIAPIPVPSAFLLLASGLLGIVRLRRKI